MVKGEIVEFEGNRFKMIYDINSSRRYKKITGKSFMQTLKDMDSGDLDEIDFLEMIVVCLKDENGDYIELSFFDDYNPMSVIGTFAEPFKNQLTKGLNVDELMKKAQQIKNKNYMSSKANGNKKKNRKNKNR